jgi:hypothetical protein
MLSRKTSFVGAAAVLATAGLALAGPPFVNQGLVGVGRINANTFDQRGPGLDTLGGIFSSMHLDASSLSRQGNTYSGTLFGLPDRGFGDGATNYLARQQTFSFSFTPHYGPGPAPQNQFQFTNTATRLYTYDGGINFTGFDPADTSIQDHPQSLPSSLGGGRRSLDAEGLVIMPDGSSYVSDEYGPFIYKFNPSGELVGTIKPNDALIGKNGGSYPRPTSFTAGSNPASGRRSNRGLEGLSISPDGKTLIAALQSPTIQDGGANNLSRNTRILTFDIDPQSPSYEQQVGEYVYQLTTQGSAQNNRHTPISEIHALSSTTFLVLERDGVGLGSTTSGPISYKKINLADISGATNLLGTGYALEDGAPGQTDLPLGNLPAGITPAARLDFVDMLDLAQLSKFGLNLNAFGSQDQNTLGEKWEGLALIPVGDPDAPDDYFLLVGNDNDYKAAQVFHNGEVVGSNSIQVDNMILVYRVTLPADGIIPAPGAAGLLTLGGLAAARRRRR